jgi:hypothetical protein
MLYIYNKNIYYFIWCHIFSLPHPLIDNIFSDTFLSILIHRFLVKDFFLTPTHFSGSLSKQYLNRSLVSHIAHEKKVSLIFCIWEQFSLLWLFLSSQPSVVINNKYANNHSNSEKGSKYETLPHVKFVSFL